MSSYPNNILGEHLTVEGVSIYALQSPVNVQSTWYVASRAEIPGANFNCGS